MRFFIRQQSLLVLPVCCLFAAAAHLVRADEPGDIRLDEQQRAAVTKFLEAAKKTWDEVYGNVHYEMVQTYEFRSTKFRRRVVTEIKYWSRDNKYFRLDTKTIQSNDPSEKVGKRRRIVVGPDGFVRLSAKSAGKPLAIVGWGATEEGLDNLLGDFSVLASVRCRGLKFAIIEIGESVGSELTREIPSFLMKKGVERKLTSVTLSDERSRCEIKWMQYFNEPLSCESIMLCDVEHGVVLRYDGRFTQNGILSSVLKENKEYEFERFRGVPSYYRYHLDATGPAESDKYSRTSEFRPRLVDWDPVPMGIFSLEAQGLLSVAPGSVWNRRMLTLLAGLVLLGIFVAVKRARNRATE